MALCKSNGGELKEIILKVSIARVKLETLLMASQLQTVQIGVFAVK